MDIQKAEFITSSPRIEDCPEAAAPEYAFIGRSNVGKSSLINMLTQRKGLAKISGRPGKTQLINHFKINDKWYLVDLPGYGYAKVGKKARQTFQKIIEDYILERSSLANLFVLIDCRHEPQKIDLEFMEWLGQSEVAFSLVFTKTDKLSKVKLTKSIQRYNKRLLEDWAELPVQFVSSAENGAGRTEILSYIHTVNQKIGI